MNYVLRKQTFSIKKIVLAPPPGKRIVLAGTFCRLVKCLKYFNCLLLTPTLLIAILKMSGSALYILQKVWICMPYLVLCQLKKREKMKNFN